MAAHSSVKRRTEFDELRSQRTCEREHHVETQGIMVDCQEKRNRVDGARWRSVAAAHGAHGPFRVVPRQRRHARPPPSWMNALLPGAPRGIRAATQFRRAAPTTATRRAFLDRPETNHYHVARLRTPHRAAPTCRIAARTHTGSVSLPETPKVLDVETRNRRAASPA